MVKKSCRMIWAFRVSALMMDVTKEQLSEQKPLPVPRQNVSVLDKQSASFVMVAFNIVLHDHWENLITSKNTFEHLNPSIFMRCSQNFSNKMFNFQCSTVWKSLCHLGTVQETTRMGKGDCQARHFASRMKF